MASVETDSSSTELEVRYTTNCREYYECICEVNFIEGCVVAVNAINTICVCQQHSILFVHLICPSIVLRLDQPMI